LKIVARLIYVQKSSLIDMLRTPRWSPPEKWKPKQCVPVNSAVFQEVAGNASQQLAKYIVNLVGPFTPGSVVHDNACGTGVVSKEVMETSPSAGQDITIHTTDLSEVMVGECHALAIKKGWKMTSQVMAMQDLTFADKTFTHSVTNLAMFALDPEDASKAAAHIYRTLQEDGVAVITVWEETATGDALQAAHNTTRSTATILPMFSRPQWKNTSHVRQVLTKAGFLDEKIEITRRWVDIEVKDIDRWSNVMWTLMGRPAGGWQEGDEEKWDAATALIRENCRKSRDFHTTADGECRIRNWVNIVVARK
jgi:ubiquinone/menaquinone biosynthesis C-methylase UbiE